MQKHVALLVIDVQPDFCPGGALAVPGGDEILPLVNRLSQAFETVVLTQDWHPPGHISFVSNHPGKRPFEEITLPYGPQLLWPAHCVMETKGAALHPDLSIPHARAVIRKGSHIEVDSYSAFLEADRITRTGLDGYLASRGIRDLYICGLALDFCVAWSAQDARAFGFNVTIIEDACRAIDLNGSLVAAWNALEKVGVKRINSTRLTGDA
ncbi:bifunctional nicotinamidase/pyrazinamidase [Acidocella aminolytica]|jgi:nicotinamidase/pyrazinamidase|uniref:Nicotinamidase n=1 Tax=Acidocella aminolytica 101 = DSM 11237 TaxID=1120923 RepID=A0A0D6PEY1_9PROT|nr:bifunctional nicotinamidase/pyrazinamidase [Acidocella aminolytica]GAN80217.1 nicotinamidase [Acidocella aminolytica 101 = DSM 11237]GBQ37221.1 nicotinamidase [Acidocella aminolytica 101 = DSM 11237]SHF29967.1 nicotinamidase/pyrazinamidase [Acidocella aminolytica 101 = DSM 11237]